MLKESLQFITLKQTLQRFWDVYLQILRQCTSRLELNKAACRMYTEDGTIILENDDLIEWAVQNYRSLMADHLERLYQGKTGNYRI